jgi:hypothetical protein
MKMIEQYYAVHKKTGEVFCHKGRYCFSEKGILQSIRNDISRDEWGIKRGFKTGPTRFLVDYEIKKVELT